MHNSPQVVEDLPIVSGLDPSHLGPPVRGVSIPRTNDFLLAFESNDVPSFYRYLTRI